MSCILKITDPILSKLVNKSEFNSIDELRDSFGELINEHSVIPMNIQSNNEEFTRRKFGKVYEEDQKIKVQLVMPGQEFFDQFQLGRLDLPEESRSSEFYGQTELDNYGREKVLTFNSLDSFLAFYLANYLYVAEDSYKKLIDSLIKAVDNTLIKIENKKQAGAIEDIRFANSLVNYTKILFEQANVPYPDSVNQLYDKIIEKVKLYHKEQLEISKEKPEPLAPKEEIVKANLFFQAFDVVGGKIINKPLAQARRRMIELVGENPSAYQIKLVQGSTEQVTQSGDDGKYPTIVQIEQGVVGQLIKDGQVVYLGKDELTTNPEEATLIEYEVEGEKRKSNLITFPFLNVHKELKEQFKASTEKSKYVYNILNTKKQVEYARYGQLEELGLGVEDIQINIVAGQKNAGQTYTIKDGRKIIINADTLNAEEINEVVKLLEHEYEDERQVKDVVKYLNDLLSTSDGRRDIETTGREISFWEDGLRIKVLPRRIKEGNNYVTVDSPKVLIEENKELVLSSLGAARIRFRKGQGANLQFSWKKYWIDDELKSKTISIPEGKKFYREHLKEVQVERITSSQMAVFTEPVVPTKDQPVQLGSLIVIKGKEYTKGQINQQVFLPLATEKFEQQVWETIYNLASPRFVFQSFENVDLSVGVNAFYEKDTNTIFLRYGAINTPDWVTRALLEEMLHAVTIPKLVNEKDSDQYKALEKDYDKAKQLRETYKTNEKYQSLSNTQKERMDFLVNYHLDSIEEFVAGISQPYFRAFLRLGEGTFLEQVIEKVKKILNKILKGLVPSLYTETTTDLFNFLLTKPVYTPVIEQTLGQGTVPKKEAKQTKQTKREVTLKPKFFSAPEEVSIQVIQSLDAEIGDLLFKQGLFGDFIQGNLYTADVWNSYFNYLIEEDEQGVDAERQKWINYFVDNEQYLLEQWSQKSTLYTFTDGKITIEEEDEIDQAENPQEQEGKDPGYNKVDSEQKYSRLQLADKYAKILVKLTPKGYKNGALELVDFTNYWNKLQNVLKNTLSIDEQKDILKEKGFTEILNRLESLPSNVVSQIIVSSFQTSMGTAEVPVYNSYFTVIEDSNGNVKGYDYSFFESESLDIQRLETQINSSFREFAEPYLIDRGYPTYDNNKLVDFLSKGNLVDNYRKLGFPIPDGDKFIRDADLINFNQFLIRLLKQRNGNAYIINGDFLGYIKKKSVWEQAGKYFESEGIPTALSKVLNQLTDFSEITVSNMTKNAEGENQSVLLSWSSWLINLKKLNEGTSFREQNPIFKHSLLTQIVNENNPIVPINLSGSRYFDGSQYEGTVSMNLDYIPYLRQEVTNFMLRGIAEINRAETKNSTFGYLVNWGDKQSHPIALENFISDNWSYDITSIFLGYFRGERERIQTELDNPYTYYSKYDSIKDKFHLFGFLSDKLKVGDPSSKEFKQQFRKEMGKYFDLKINQLKQDVLNQTGLPLNQNHPVFNVVQVQKKIKELGFDNFLRAYVVNRTIYEIEHFIISEGELGQHDKPYKRFGSNISTGVPVVLSTSLNQVLNQTINRTFTERIPTGKSFVIEDDIYQYPTEQLKSGIEQSLKDWYSKMGIDKSENEIDNISNQRVKPYQETNVADGQGFMTPDFGRMLMMAAGTWNLDREEGYTLLVLQHKKDKGVPFSEEEQYRYDYVNSKVKEKGVYWTFPPLKLQYRGPFITKSNVVIEGLDKFSLAWLWPSEVEGTKFELILNKMFEEGYDYGKFKSATKIGTFTPDDLLEQVKSGNIVISSGHDIDLTYMKEQVKASDKFKDKMPMSTQARKLLLSNLKKDGKYLNDSIQDSVNQWISNQQEISESNKANLLKEISTDGNIDNYKLAEKIKQELTKRDLPQNLKALFENYQGQMFEQSLSPQMVETLIFSLLKNNIVRPKFPGEHYIQVASPLFDREQRDLAFYQYNKDKTTPADCKIVLSGEFLKLLNIPEIWSNIKKDESVYNQLSEFEKIEYRRYILNQLLLIPEFRERYKNQLTVFSSRIPGQGYNSMDVQIVKEFLPTYYGPVIVPNPLATAKSGTDFDFDKLPTITPELTKTGKWKESKVNLMIRAAENILLDPLNFNRLVTPNTTVDIDVVVKNTLEKLGEDVSEPRFDNVFNLVSHLRKWWATKMKDSLGIGATNNTFFTLAQEANLKVNPTFNIGKVSFPTIVPFKKSGTFSDPLVEDKDKLEYINQFINITVDVASNDKIGYTNLRRDNTPLLLFLVENGVSFEDSFYFINQPAIIKYYQELGYYLDQGVGTGQARRLVITKLLGISTKVNGKNVPKEVVFKSLIDLIQKKEFTNLLSTIVSKDQIPTSLNNLQKQYLAYYLIGLEMADKMREIQSYNNFDTSPSPNYLFSESREQIKQLIEDSDMFTGWESIHNDSVISHLNVNEEFKQISEVAFPIKRSQDFVVEALRLGSMIYNQEDKQSFFRKFDNDYLLAILQNFGNINSQRVETLLKGKLMQDWRKIKSKVKDLTISKYITENYSTKSDKISPSIFLGLDDDTQTIDQITNDLREMLDNTDTKEFAKDFIEVGMYSILFNQSPVYYLKMIPHEVVNQYLKEAYNNYTRNTGFIQQFSKKFRYQRGMAFSKYFIDEYKNDGIENLRGKNKLVLFNQEPWRYLDYKLSLEELKQPNQPEEQEQKDCDSDIPF